MDINYCKILKRKEKEKEKTTIKFCYMSNEDYPVNESFESLGYVNTLSESEL